VAQYIIQRISISGFMFSLLSWVCFFIGIWHGRQKKYNLSLKEIIDALSGIRIALVKDNKSDKSDIVLEEMSSNQGSYFLF